MPRDLPKVYLRLDPNLDAHADPEAMLKLMLWANRQPHRGRFRDLAVLRRVLGPKRLQAAIDRGDLREDEDGTGYYLAGWDEWQEGDHTVGERVARIRDRRKSTRARQEAPSNAGAELQAVERYGAVTSPFPERKSPSEALGVGRNVPVASLPVRAQAGRPASAAVPAPAELREQCRGLLDRGSTAAAALGVAWDAGAEFGAASQTPRGDRLALRDLDGRRGSTAWWQATRDRLEARVAALQVPVLQTGNPPTEPAPTCDRAAAALWDQCLELTRTDLPAHAWRTLSLSVGARVTDRLLVLAPAATAALSRQLGTAAAALVHAAAALGHPVVGIDWHASTEAFEAEIDAAHAWLQPRWGPLRLALGAWLEHSRQPDEPLVAAVWRWLDEPTDGPSPPVAVARLIVTKLSTEDSVASRRAV